MQITLHCMRATNILIKQEMFTYFHCTSTHLSYRFTSSDIRHDEGTFDGG